MSQYSLAGRRGVAPLVEADELAEGGNSESGVAWAAIFGGAFAALALSLVLITLGTGFGLATVSPWPRAGASATSFKVITAVWLIVVQWLASALGGYLTGRLRTKWVGLHTHEVFFRDTANGFLSWATATIAGVIFLVSAGSLGLGAASNNVNANAAVTPTSYYVDTLYRSDRPVASSPSPDEREQSSRILVNATREPMPADDANYLATLVALRTGVTQQAATQRVADVTDQMRRDADAVRKSTATLAIFTALSLIIGAFIASAAGAIGGLQRDEY